MNQQSRNLCRLVSLWAILLGAVMARAEADDDNPTEEVPTGEVETEGVIVVEKSTIDQWIFRANGAKAVPQKNGQAPAARTGIDSQLNALLDELAQVCQLSEPQRHKLTLAGNGDVKRFFDQVDKVYKMPRGERVDQNQLQQIRRDCNALQQQYSRGLFGDESLFGKALGKTLTDEQQAKYQAAMLFRRRAGYRVAIEESLSNLGNGVLLRREQRDSLQKLLLDETQPPLLFGRYDRHVVMFRLSQLPTAKLKEVLDKGQWKLLQPQLLQASGTEDTLARVGVIEEPKLNSPVVLRSVRTVVAAPTTDAAAAADSVKPE